MDRNFDLKKFGHAQGNVDVIALCTSFVTSGDDIIDRQY